MELGSTLLQTVNLAVPRLASVCAAQPVMRLSWAFQTAYSSLRQISPFAIPAVLFAFIYNQVYLYWLATVGLGSWAPAWPAGRTRLVFFMVSIPTWGFAMATWTIAAAVVQTLWARKRAGPEYEAINLDPEQNRAHGRSPRRGYHQYRWHITLLVYLSLFFCGLFMLSTYEQPADVRYRPDILAALKSPKPEGHGNGGEHIMVSSRRV